MLRGDAFIEVRLYSCSRPFLPFLALKCITFTSFPPVLLLSPLFLCPLCVLFGYPWRVFGWSFRPLVCAKILSLSPSRTATLHLYFLAISSSSLIGFSVSSWICFSSDSCCSLTSFKLERAALGGVGLTTGVALLCPQFFCLLFITRMQPQVGYGEGVALRSGHVLVTARMTPLSAVLEVSLRYPWLPRWSDLRLSSSGARLPGRTWCLLPFPLENLQIPSGDLHRLHPIFPVPGDLWCVFGND